MRWALKDARISVGRQGQGGCEGQFKRRKVSTRQRLGTARARGVNGRPSGWAGGVTL